MRAKIFQGWVYLRQSVGLPTLLLIALTGSYFLYTVIRDWQTRRQIEQQSVRIEQYNQQSQAAVEKASAALARFEIDRKATNLLLEAVKEMSGNIKQLAENDRVFTIRVNDLSKDYEKTRNQKSSNPVRSNRSLRQRESDVLRADAELYK